MFSSRVNQPDHLLGSSPNNGQRFIGTFSHLAVAVLTGRNSNRLMVFVGGTEGIFQAAVKGMLMFCCVSYLPFKKFNMRLPQIVEKVQYWWMPIVPNTISGSGCSVTIVVSSQPPRQGVHPDGSRQGRPAFREARALCLARGWR